jgi:hypothetical protein
MHPDMHPAALGMYFSIDVLAGTGQGTLGRSCRAGKEPRALLLGLHREKAILDLPQRSSFSSFCRSAL